MVPCARYPCNGPCYGALCDGPPKGRRTMNSLPLPTPSLRALDRAAVKLDELARQGESDAHAGTRFDIVGMALRKQLEDFAELSCGMPTPVS